MAQDEDQPGPETRRTELHASHLRRSDDVAGDANDEEVPQALVEDDLGGNARIRTAENDGERLLAGGQLGASRVSGQRLGTPEAQGEPAVPLTETLESCDCVDHFSGWQNCPVITWACR